MPAKPPPPPAQILARVTRTAVFNGRLQFGAGVAMALVNALNQVGSGAILGCLISGAGALQLHGRTQLHAGDYLGHRWLIRSQLLLLGAVFIFCAVQMGRFDPALVEQIEFTAKQTAALEQANLTKEQAVHGAYILGLVLLGLFSLLYQGALALYYWLKREAVARALTGDDAGELTLH